MKARAVYLESVAGIAGDMFAAAFVDAGLVTADELRAIPAKLGLAGVKVEVSHPIRATMKCTHVKVSWTGDAWRRALGGGHAHGDHVNVRSGHSHAEGQWHTHYADLDAFLAKSSLEAGTKELSRKVFRCLAEAEGAAHGVSVEDVAFHEVGAVDSIVDVVMAAYCLGRAGAERVYASPVRLGRGTVEMEHGTHPVPPPASARLAIGFPVAEVPAAVTRPNVELSTPTGLAILKALSPRFVQGVPAGTVVAQGMGAGTMDLGPYPNVFRVVLLEEGASMGEGSHFELPYERDQVVEIACNLDDETAERTAWAAEHLMEVGALDVWVTPVTGKKGRPSMLLTVLADAGRWTQLADWLLRHTSTFGVRHHVWDRLKLARKVEERKNAGQTVRYKIGMTTSGEVLKEKPEYEDVRKVWAKDPGFHP